MVFFFGRTCHCTIQEGGCLVKYENSLRSRFGNKTVLNVELLGAGVSERRAAVTELNRTKAIPTITISLTTKHSSSLSSMIEFLFFFVVDTCNHPAIPPYDS